MFLNIKLIVGALEHLKPVHPFYTLTFLVCKTDRLPVESAISYRVNAAETKFLEQYYKPIKDSKYFYKVSRVNNKEAWLKPDHASKGSQKTRTTTFKDAFIQPIASDWGWSLDYVKILKSKLHKGKLVPAFDMAIWLYREREWKPNATAENILETFFTEFFITEEEKSELFDLSIPEISDRSQLFQEQKALWNEIRKAADIPPPPDARPEGGGTLAYLELRGVGPARRLEFEPADRLNLITGDNGLGKTFLLECAWWALTGHWAGLPAYRRDDAKSNEPQIIFQILGEDSIADRIPISYDWHTQNWPTRQKYYTIPGLLIYARLDGSFAIWDPAKNYWSSSLHALEEVPIVFSREDVWNGYDVKIEGKTSTFINGLLRDWITWQNSPKKYPFKAFKKVLERLSPPVQSDLGPLTPGNPRRLPNEAKEIPTLKHPYGEVPIVHAAAGVRRIITLAYLIVWAWEEHKVQSELIRKKPETRMVIIIDEIEAHLHPQWQRRILPALLKVTEDLDPTLRVQFFVATHSPLVMASVEPVFNPESDKLFHLNIVESEVELEEIAFVRYGRVDRWLMSDIFELDHARSLEAEAAIEAAKALQLQDKPDPVCVNRVSEDLVKYLAPDDEFWPRWKYFAEKHGVRFDPHPSTT